MKQNRIAGRESSFEYIFRSRGLRVTPQRVAIYGELSGALDHPSTNAVYKKVRRALPNISFDTVYRTLLLFSEKGIIKTVEETGDETRFEPNLERHHHFKCLKCRRIIDFYENSLNDIKIPAGLNKKFKILNKRVVLEGLCESCGKK